MVQLKKGHKSDMEKVIGFENMKYESLIFKLFRDECVLEQMLLNE